MTYTLKDLLDIPKLQELMAAMDEIHSMPSAVIDIEGNILTATAWQDICTKFHRMNPETRKKCIESDTHIKTELNNNCITHVTYHCPMGLVDAATPIIIGGQHLGNVFTGQFFMEPPDEDYFIKQAQQYGFDECEYLEAMRRVPFFSEATLHKNLTFIHSLTQMLAEQGLQYKKQCEAENALREKEELYRDLFARAGEGIIILSSEGRLVEVNDSFAKMHGYSPSEMQLMGLEDLDTPESSRLAPERIRRLLTGEALTFEVEHYHKDGHIFPLEVSASLISSGEKSYFQCFHRDITERKQIEGVLFIREQALARSERFLKTIIDSEPECIKLLDSDCNLLMMNPAGLEMIQADFFEQVKGQCICPLVTHPFKNDFIALTKQVFQGISGTLEFEIVGLKGRHVWLDTHAVPFRNETGEIVALLGITRDVTEQKKLEAERVVLEQQFQQAQKMECLGVLAGGIAHDFNNLLAVIIGHCSLAKLRPTTFTDNITLIETAAERAAALCQQMLVYAGKAHITKSQVNLVELVMEMVTLSSSTIGQNVQITCDLASDIPPIIVDASQVRQITMNLIINASEAIGESQGEVRVSLASKEVRTGQQEKDHLGNIIPSGWYACLEVADNGCGMDVETQRRIFEPFYTTKFTGRGLGMSAVLGIITAHNGALKLLSQPGLGTTFTVYLPIKMSMLTESQSPQQSAAPDLWKGNGTVLLVEDEELVIGVAEAMLEELGFKVIKASNGKEALELYHQHSTDITLVLTDIGMPVMDGYALVIELKKVNPALPIIVSSGFADMDVSSRLSPDDVAGQISKPYSFDKMSDLLKETTGCSHLINVLT